MSEIKTFENGACFDDILVNSTAKIQAIASALRDLIATVMPGVTEVVWQHQKIAGYGVGPKKMSEHFCYVAPHTNHVNLGFSYGADLSDHTGLLEGNGKKLRHIKVDDIEKINDKELKKLLLQASKHLPKLNN